jgi:hypothetical protein
MPRNLWELYSISQQLWFFNKNKIYLQRAAKYILIKMLQLRDQFDFA